MKAPSMLLPHRYRILGWILSIPALTAGIYFMIAEPEFDALDARVPALIGEADGDIFGDNTFFIMMKNNLTDELVGAVLLIGLFLLCFTRERNEDEYIARVRSESMQWAVFVQMCVFFMALLTVYGIPFWSFMLINLYLLPLVFVVRYYSRIYKINRAS